jgi:hypothetical protein
MLVTQPRKQLKGQPPKEIDKICMSSFIIFECDDCKKQEKISYHNYIKNKKIYSKDLCRGCKLKKQYDLGLRTSCFSSYNKTLFAGPWEKRYGEEKANQLKQICSKNSSGENNPNYGAKFSHGFGEQYLTRKGKSYETLYGNKKAHQLKQLKSKKYSGKGNPMYGRPSPQGSGNGWCGWYKTWFFRSLKELSFMINYIEAKNLEWESGEKAIYKILYKDPITGNDRTYVCDFKINNQLIEIKPKNLLNTLYNKAKFAAAKKWCKQHKLEHKVFTENDFNLLTNQEIVNLYKSKQIKFIKRYEEKFIKMMEDSRW